MTGTRYGKVPAFLLSSLWALQPGATAVYLALACHRNRAGHAWPSMRTVADSLGCDRSTVHRGLRALKEAGLVRPDGQDRSGTIRYYLPQTPIELPEIAIEAGINLPEATEPPLCPKESQEEGHARHPGSGRPATQTEKGTEEQANREVPIGELRTDILADFAFFNGCFEAKRKELATHVENLASRLDLPAGRIKELLSQGLEEDRESPGRWLIRFLEEEIARAFSPSGAPMAGGNGGKVVLSRPQLPQSG